MNATMERYYNANPWHRKHADIPLSELALMVHDDFTGNLWGYYMVRCTNGK